MPADTSPCPGIPDQVVNYFWTIWRDEVSKRKIYTAEFKAAAVSRLLEGGEKPSVVSRELGVTLTQLKTCRMAAPVSVPAALVV